MTTLKTILEATERESLERQHKYSLAMVQRKVAKMGPTRGFGRALRQHPFSVIAEIKRKSPSMGKMLNEADIEIALQVYHQHPVVSAISVLTQKSHFGGTTDYLERVRNLTQRKPKPILRKDFIVSEYEVYFSRWLGADAILLMANVLDAEKFERLHNLATSLGLDVLCEVHDQDEIDIVPNSARICGINSRRFKGVKHKRSVFRRFQEALGFAPDHDTQTDLNAFALFPQLRTDVIRVAESGVSSENIGSVLENYPFEAALIGTSLLQNGRAEMKAHLDKIHEVASRSKVADPVASEPAFA